MLVVGLLVWWSSSDDASSSGVLAPAEVDPTVEPTPVERQVSARAAQLGSLTGVVRLEGRGVGKAVVKVKATVPLATETLDDGAFRLDGLMREPIFVAASSEGGLASDVLGPFVIEPGQTVSGVVLELKPTVALNGVVHDVVTRAPIARAVVSWSGGSTQTDAKGAFTLAAPKSQVWLDVMAKGYLPRTEWVSLELARTGGRLELPLSPVSSIEGVVTEMGTPRAGVSVWAELTEGARRGDRSMVVLTDKKGQFHLECSEGLRRVVAVTPAGVRAPGPELRLAIGEARKGLSLELGDLGPITGTVTRDGAPFGGATLTLINAQTEDPVATVTAFLDGRFSAPAVPLGRYLVQVRLGAFTALAGPLDHREEGQPWVVAVKGGGVLSGRVEAPEPGVRVRWRSGAWAGPSAETSTGADGTFSFEGVPEGSLLVDAEGPTGAATTAAKAGDLVVLKLERGKALVRVLDASGAAVSEAVMMARSDETAAVRRYVLTAPDGVFQIDLPRGRWVLMAEVNGRGRTNGVLVTVSGPPVDVTLTLTATTSVSGRVIDAVTRLPLQGARVRAESAMGRVSVLTDARGTFQLPPQPQAVQLLVGRDGFAAQGFYLPSRPDASNLTVELQPTPNSQFQEEPARFEGVGMTLKPNPGFIMVAVVNEGSPAERAGVRAGDVIISIDGQPAGADLGNVVGRIRGPAGTPVTLGFDRQGQRIELTIRRKSLLMSYW